MSGDALVFIPGIKGTKLVETNRSSWDTIWSGIQSNFETIRHLELVRGGGGTYYDERLRSIIQPGEIETLAYGEFLSDLDTERPIYIFNYDWRLSADRNGDLLDEFLKTLVEKSKATTGARRFQKFDFVTHSLGNFVLRNYLKKKGFSKVEKIVFTVPPFRGSIDIVAAALVGEGWFPNVKSSIRKILRTMPGALELLPGYDEASAFDTGARHSFFNYNHWQGNVAENTPAGLKLKKALADAKRTFQGGLLDLATVSAERRRRMLVIVRNGYDTFQSIRVQRDGPGHVANFVDFEGAARTDDGDGRVPHMSSCCYAEQVKTLILDDAFWFREYSHGFVLKDERVQKMVNRFLFKGGRFSHRIPGGSIRVVTGLERKTTGAGLPYWAARSRA